jgi:hypothetical protein
MGKLTPLYLALMATFLCTVLAGCALEIATGSVRFISDDELTSDSTPLVDGESPTGGLTP